ncbi:MAG: CDP-alcohol phosphatidyltransferase family protein [Acidimicrobiales bacterium]
MALRRTGVTPDQLTGLGLVLAAAAGTFIALGFMIAGAVLVGFCGLADLLDGPLASATGSASVRGAFFDSVADRMSDVFLLTGLAWLAASTRHPYLGVLALGVLAASMLPSYVRAKADTLGLTARGGIMERAERMIVLGLGLFFQPFVPVLVPALCAILALSLLTAAQRFVSAWRQATSLPDVTVASSTVASSTVAGSGSAREEPGRQAPSPRARRARRSARVERRIQAGSVQAGSVQAGPVQAGPVQAGPVQAGPVQAGPVQAGPVQAGLRRHVWGGGS